MAESFAQCRHPAKAVTINTRKTFWQKRRELKAIRWRTAPPSPGSTWEPVLNKLKRKLLALGLLNCYVGIKPA